MFRFFERFWGKKEKEVKRWGVTLLELREWCEGRLGEYESGVIKELWDVVGRALKLKEDAEGILEELEGYEFPEDIRRRVYKPVLTHRPAYVRGMREALSGLKQPERSMDGFRGFLFNLNNTLLGVQKIQLGQGRFLAHVFQEQLYSLGGLLNKIIDTKEECEEVLNDYEVNTKGIKEVVKKADALDSCCMKLKRLGIEIENLEAGLSDLNEGGSELSDELAKLISSSRYKRFKEEKDKLEKMRLIRQETEAQILNHLRPKARVFRKYRKYLDDRSESNVFLDGYLNDPVGSFLKEEPGCPQLKRIFNGIEKAREERSISLDEKEIRVLGVDWQVLDRLREEVLRSSEQEDLDDTPEKDRGQLELKIRDMGAEKERLNLSIAENKKEAKRLKKSIKDLRRELEGEFSGLRGGDYSVEVPSNSE